MRHTAKNHVDTYYVPVSEINGFNTAVKEALDDPPSFPDPVKAGSGREIISADDNDNANAIYNLVDIQGTKAELDRIQASLLARNVTGIPTYRYDTSDKSQIDRTAQETDLGVRPKPDLED